MCRVFIVCLIFFNIATTYAFANDSRMSPELYRSYGKQQQISKDAKGNKILVTPHYKSYEERNQNVSEKIVAIYDKRSPAYGYRYVLYSPIGKYVGHRRIEQPSPNGYGFDPVPEGGEGSQVPCFRSLKEAKHFYYPQWY